MMLGVNNLTDLASLSGGSWLSGFPVTNLQSRQQGIIARSTNATTANTKIDVNLGGAGRGVRVIGIFNHNFSSAATIQFVAYTDSTRTVIAYDSGAIAVEPNVFQAGYATNWDDPTPGTPRQYFGYEKTLLNVKQDFIYVVPSSVERRYWTFFIADTANTNGYVQLGRLFIGPGFEPTYNFDFGVKMGVIDNTIVKKAMDGSSFFDVKPTLRTAQFTIAHMSEIEGYQSIYDILRSSGINKEVVFIYDSADTYNSLRRRFMGVMRQLSDVENTNYGLFQSTFEIEEVL